jgi:hypothetical protein
MNTLSTENLDKMKAIRYISYLFLALLVLASCQEDPPTVDDHFLNYEIPDVPPDADYTVGAHYSSFEWSANLTEIPSAGQYDALNGDPAVYAQHIVWAGEAGIDFFVFNMRSGAMDPGYFSTDSAFVATLHTASGASNMSYALAYTFDFPGGYGEELSETNPIESTDYVDNGIIADFQKMLPFFQESNYMKVNGAAVVYIRSAHELFATDNAALYDQIRAAVGVDLYLIGEQNNWSPPMRYDFRFEDGVDAVTHMTYAQIGAGQYDRYIMFGVYTDQAWTFSRDELAKINLEYIPQISPSYNAQINDPANTSMVITKNQEWFTVVCNVAKRASSPSRIILLDSFNTWNFDKQVEPAQSYGKAYLEILREQFKVN